MGNSRRKFVCGVIYLTSDSFPVRQTPTLTSQRQSFLNRTYLIKGLIRPQHFDGIKGIFLHPAYTGSPREDLLPAGRGRKRCRDEFIHVNVLIPPRWIDRSFFEQHLGTVSCLCVAAPTRFCHMGW
jgi:hypothetical protein